MSRLDNVLVVGTAGHVDHGKSAIVKAITGIDPDRLPDEKRRGMTIDLGFANVTLPSGRALSFVDVPGHERLVTNMIAGAAGVDAGLLVIAADEGIMPQTREHVAILDLLGVAPTLIALTKADLVDAERLGDVSKRIREFLRDGPFADSPIFAVSARTGYGLESLTEAMEQLPITSETGSVTRLTVDRVFTMSGFGTVVTGYSMGLGFGPGDEVEVHPAVRRARIRGVRQHGLSLASRTRGRTALNLSGVARHEVKRGDVIAFPGSLSDCSRFDGTFRVLSDSEVEISQGQAVVVHAGTDTVGARIYPLETQSLKPGACGWVQIRFDRPVAVWRGQPFVVRRPSPTVTLGGGRVADVKPRRRSRGTNLDQLVDLLGLDIDHAVLALLRLRAATPQAVATVVGLTPTEADSSLGRLEHSAKIAKLGFRWMTRETVNEYARLIHSTLVAFGNLGVTRDELRRVVRLNSTELADLLERMFQSGSIEVTRQTSTAGLVATSDNSTIRAKQFANNPSTASDSSPRGSPILDLLNRSGWQPPPIDDLLQQLGLERTTLTELENAGRIMRIESWLYLTSGHYEALVALVCRLVQQQGGMTISELKSALGTSRKYALAYAADLDSKRITRRDGDVRGPGKNLEQVKRQLANSG